MLAGARPGGAAAAAASRPDQEGAAAVALAATAAAGEREEKGKENDFCSFFELLGKRGRAMLISKVFFRFRPEV